MDNQYVSLFKTKRFWGFLLSIVSFLLEQFGIKFAFDDAMIAQFVDLSTAILQVAGMFYALYGGIVANRKIVLSSDKS